MIDLMGEMTFRLICCSIFAAYLHGFCHNEVVVRCAKLFYMLGVIIYIIGKKCKPVSPRESVQTTRQKVQ
jgi:hypothetical protein